jgi:hypothetical protein
MRNAMTNSGGKNRMTALYWDMGLILLCDEDLREAATLLEPARELPILTLFAAL